MKPLAMGVAIAILAAFWAAPAAADTDHEALSKEVKAGPARRELIGKMITLLQEDMEKELRFEATDDDLKKRVEEMTFDAESVQALSQELLKLRRDVPAGRTAAMLLERAAETVKDDKALKELASTAQKMEARYRYKPLPNLKGRSTNLPDKYPAGASVAALMKSLEAAQRSQLQGEIRGKEVEENNAVVRDMQKVHARLLLKSGSPGGGSKVAKMIADEERRGVLTFSGLLNVVRDEAKHVQPAEADRMYRSLTGYAQRIQLKKAKYYKPWEGIYKKGKKPEFGSKNNHWPYLDFVKAINALAPIAKQPALQEPSRKELESEHNKRFGKNKKSKKK